MSSTQRYIDPLQALIDERDAARAEAARLRRCTQEMAVERYRFKHEVEAARAEAARLREVIEAARPVLKFVASLSEQLERGE